MKNTRENKKELFTSDDIALECPKKMVWDEMEVVGEGRRFCEGCDKTLFDVTGYGKEEVQALQKEHGNICVAVGKVLVASSLSLSLLAAGGDIGKVEIESVVEASNIEVVGIIDPEPIPVVVEITMVGKPPLLPVCDDGTKNLNAIKRFFGFNVDRSCRDD